jgi:uncharacterized protein (TIGR01777 family)
MRIIIAGGTGFIGQALVEHFLNRDHQLVILGRNKQKITNLYQGRLHRISALTWDEFRQKPSQILSTSDLVINLAGENIGQKRWSTKRKRKIFDSRIQTTTLLAESCAELGKDSPALFSASALSVYGPQTPLVSSLPPPFRENELVDFEKFTNFLTQIARSWEKVTHIAQAKNVRVVNLRFAVVLDKKGLIAKLIPAFKLGLGGPIGSGHQPFPFISLADLIRAIDFLINNPKIHGPVNFVAPECITQSQFAKNLAKALHRPVIFKTPSFLLKSVFGEMGEELLLNGQCAYPEVLLSNGFQFDYPTLEAILYHIFKE